MTVVRAGCDSRHHARAPRNRGRVASTGPHGASVPVQRARALAKFLTSREAVLVMGRVKDVPQGPGQERRRASLEQAVVWMRLEGVEGGNRAAAVQGLEPGISACFFGNDPKKWQPQ